MTARIFITDAVILKRSNISETDRLITVLTPHFGKIMLKAPGIRRITSRKGPHLEMFTHSKLTLAKGRTFFIVTEAITQEHFSLLRTDLNRLFYAYQAAEIVVRLLAEGVEAFLTYKALCSCLKSLNDPVKDPSIAVDEFIHEILWEQGFLTKGSRVSSVKLQQYLVNVLERELSTQRLLIHLA